MQTSKMLDIDLKKEKERAIYLLSFLLPLILMIAMMISKKVFPFGDKCILRTDFYHQYLPFHTELQYKLKNFSNLFYTLNVGLGTNFISLFAYYLASPFNLLLLIIPENFVIEYLTLMVILKIALSSLTMSYYLVKKYDTDSFVVIFFAIFYSMSGYMAAYYWNVMWLDNIVLFPLLMYGFERMYNNKFKPFVYIITLGLSILCNYYIGTITCIFLFIYFFFYSILREVKIKAFFKNLAKTAIYSIIGIMLAGVLLIPIFYAFNTTASSDISFPKSAREYFTIIEVIARHLPFVKVENGIEYWPNLYCGIFCFALIILYFISKKVKLKEKIVYGVLFLFFIASFSISILDFVWHIFKFPNSLPARQSFIYIFLLLSVCIKPLLKLKSVKERDIIMAFVIPIAFLIIIEKSVININVGFYSVYTAIIFLIIYLVLFLCYNNKKYDKNIIFYITIIVVCFEVFINMYQTSISTIKRDDYVKNTSSIKIMVKGLENVTDDFYRVERAEMKTKNDGAFMHFPSASIFSSSAYADGTEFYKNYGMEASTNAYSTTGSTPFADSLLSIRYKIYEKEEKHAKELNKRLISDDGEVFMYQNLDTLPFSYILTNDFIKDYDKSSGNPATVQNNFSRTLKVGTLLDKMDIKIDGKTATFTTEKAGDYYAFIRDKGIKEVTVIYPNTTKTFKNLNRGYFIELGYVEANTDLEFRNDDNNDELLMELFSFNFETLKRVVEKLGFNGNFENVFIKDNDINYIINSQIDGTCVVTLPYDKGFKLYVDGVETEHKKVLDFFLGFDVKKGKHDIKLVYTPGGFYIGLMVSIAGIILLIVLFVVYGKILKNKSIKLGNNHDVSGNI